MAAPSITRIAVTGGPGAGKTTVLRELAAREGTRVLAVPEVATPLLQHVFPSVMNEQERCAVQRSIFQVQVQLEVVHEQRLTAGQVLLCDRGTPDGAGYWPDGHERFFEAMHTTHEAELARYHAVLFLETAAAGGFAIDQGNPVRHEDLATAVAIDRRLHAIWSRHPRFLHVSQHTNFADKVALGLLALQRCLDELRTDA